MKQNYEQAQKDISQQLEDLGKWKALGGFVCNMEELDFDLTMEALEKGETTQSNGVEIVIWEPFENHEPEYVYEQIDNEVRSNTMLLRDARTIIQGG
jgi:hypothetical protein